MDTTVDPTAYMVVVIAMVVGLVLVLVTQIKALFCGPPPVPLKRLPLRPALSIQFKHDDTSSSAVASSGKFTANNAFPQL